jgi:hypothetical protein
MPEKPWIERILGASWQTSLVGLGGVPVALAVSWIGIVYESKELLGFGLTIFGLAVAALGVLSRSHRASVVAHEESLRGIEAGQEAHAQNVQQLQALAETVGTVPIIAAQAAQSAVQDVLKLPDAKGPQPPP